MNLQPYLENKFISMRPLSMSDKEPLYQVSKDPLIWQQHPVWDRYKREKFERFFKESLASKGALVVEEKGTHTIIGSSRYKSIENAPHALEIGWSFLARSHWGGTYNKAVKDLMIRHAFNWIEVIIFYIDMKNIRSQKAVEKLGAYLATQEKLSPLVRNLEKEYTYVIEKEKYCL